MNTPAARLARLLEQAEGMFSALTELRMKDAARGRDSDVYFGRCSALADLGLIDPSRVRQLDDAVRHTITTTTTGGNHA